MIYVFVKSYKLVNQFKLLPGHLFFQMHGPTHHSEEFIEMLLFIIEKMFKTCISFEHLVMKIMLYIHIEIV